MSLKKKIKYNSKFKRGDFVKDLEYEAIHKIEHIKVKFNHVLYFIRDKWIDESLLKQATPLEMSQIIAKRMLE